MISAVKLTGVTKRYGATTALRGVALELERGLTIIEGPNGSGKSTLLGIIGQVVRPTTGTVSYPPLTDSRFARRELGWLGHDSLCYNDLTGKQSVTFAAEVAGVDAQHAWEQASDRFELGAFANRKIRTNSRGQRQRIALARAFAHQPKVVLLDEPTTGLDRRGVGRLVEFIHQELERGALLVLVTHEPAVFHGLKSSTVQMDRGRVLEI